MQIWHIAWREIKVNLRDMRTFVLMLAFPIVLMLILGMALTNAFTSGLSLGDMNLLYRDTADNPQLEASWDQFTAAIAKEGVTLTPAPVDTDGKAEVSADHYTAYAEISNNGIAFFGGVMHTLESNVLQGMLATFADRYNLAAAAMIDSPEKAEAILTDTYAGGDFVAETALGSEKKPGSIDYYAMAMTTMVAFYSCMSGSFLIRGERLRNTAIRLSAAPVSKGTIFAGKVIGCTAINFLCVAAVFLFSKFVFKADWGDHYAAVLLVLLTEVLLAVSIGLGCSYLFMEDGGRLVVLIFTQIASFLGGAYFPVDDATNFMKIARDISPMRWANQALTQIIYGHDWLAAMPAIGLNTAVAAAFLAITAILMRRREAL
ncbi:ABC transporter permease [Paenibacillus sp. PR3]|uniref:ABC transporter permease n=1 Tax=Paenibacillus terricola TaxID=2763503 RepID=A0ABR8N2U2_9BACL|nr:ABC transporter permease [Paenibacillus terricola]MBD3922493.1 ABC transporter permease [Paenibacillus terricola]